MRVFATLHGSISVRICTRSRPCMRLLVGVQGERVPPDRPHPVAGTNYMLMRETWDLHDFSYPNEKNGNTYIGGGPPRFLVGLERVWDWGLVWGLGWFGLGLGFGLGPGGGGNRGGFLQHRGV